MRELSHAHFQRAQCMLSKSDLNLAWLDMEMTGLDPDKERIIEIAVVVTDADCKER
ncbi:MAG: oligoribonuclease, partial [Betaproteobacteria bacterium]|nr:oligoribonuclease [Betaproteobacteria bacterium]